MRKAALWLQIVAGIALTLLVAGGFLLAEDCENDGTCVTQRDDDGNAMGCGDTAGKNCTAGAPACRCVVNTLNVCKCDD